MASKIDREKSVEHVLERIRAGKGVRTICSAARAEWLPATGTFFDWVINDAALGERYARAREVQSETIGERILEIASDKTRDWQQARLETDALKWYASKMFSRRFGDKQQVEQAFTDGKGNPVNVTVTIAPKPE